MRAITYCEQHEWRVGRHGGSDLCGQARDPRANCILAMERCESKVLTCCAINGSVGVDEAMIVAPVEQLDFDVRIQLAHEAKFSILAGDELLAHRRQLD